MNVMTTDLLSEIDFINHGFFDSTGGESTGTYESLNVGIHGWYGPAANLQVSRLKI